MTLRISTGLRDHLNSGGSLRDALNNGRMEIYSGTQPSSADSAVSGTLLVTITASAGSHTAETPTTASITLTGGAAGSIDNVTIDSISILDAVVSFNTSLTQTATDLAAALNRSATNLDWIATSATTTVTLTAKPNRGTRFNGKTQTVTTTTITTSDVDPTGGVVSANGLQFEDSAAGAMVKRSSQTWSGTAGNTGTAGWFRFYGPQTDAGTADADGTKLRLDGAIASSGSQLNMTPTSIVAAAVQTISSFTPTMPSA